MRAERMGVSIIGSPLLHLWRRGKEIRGVPSPLIMASLLHDKDKGSIYSPLDSPPGVGDPRPSGWVFHQVREVARTQV